MTEKQIENAIETHLKHQITQTDFYIQRQQRIQIGSGYGIADLVLCNSLPYQMLVIIECKKSGYSGTQGLDQLKSYC